MGEKKKFKNFQCFSPGTLSPKIFNPGFDPFFLRERPIKIVPDLHGTESFSSVCLLEDRLHVLRKRFLRVKENQLQIPLDLARAFEFDLARSHINVVHANGFLDWIDDRHLLERTLGKRYDF